MKSFAGYLSVSNSSVVIGGSMDRVELSDGNLKIGKEKYHIDYWILNYRQILRRMKYSDDAIREYLGYINFCFIKYKSMMLGGSRLH